MKAALTPRKQLQVDYWGELRRLMWSRNGNVRPRKPRPHYWQAFSIGRTHFELTANFNVNRDFIAAGLQLKGENAKAHFALLQQDKEEIERELDETLYWHEKIPFWDKKLDTKFHTIHIFRESYDLANQNTWPSLLEWHFDNLEALHRVFAPRIKALDAADYIPDDIDLDDTEDELA